jgi:hypothetical protein
MSTPMPATATMATPATRPPPFEQRLLAEGHVVVDEAGRERRQQERVERGAVGPLQH